MKKLTLALAITFIFLLLHCTESSPSFDPLCIARLKGKVVSQGPACAGIAIQILSGGFNPARVDSLWFDAYADNPPMYRNVFKTYPYCNTEDEQEQLLLEAIEGGTEFYFIFTNSENVHDCGSADHTVCKLLVSLPESTNQILVVNEECNDQVIIY